MTMRERIASGKLFTDYCEGLPEDRVKAKRRMHAFNLTTPDDLDKRTQLIQEIFGKETKAWIEPPFYFCYGTNIEIGDGTYINFNCNFVDDTKIIIGKNVMFGPAVTIATVGHPIHPDYRGYMYAEPVEIENNCWIGANVTICPGVTIGENTVIGAGSVVTKDIPANSIAVGNPCRVMRTINEHDLKYYYKDKEITEEDLDEEARLR
ncbi:MULTISPECIES: DapH/DapD/GlmU-related protein [Paenibacillus]|uniref:Acetyltransferase n=1 Tax=Paenibacillus odorifer TaxID=189426 RepID=A0A1R0XYM5_9BACL|nr:MULTISPECIES: DapH/DapD/GlmU-related protein [Paenibacillus]AIQ35050.1 galactoside O-acetyltransferase [Paenibacillus sp. FSL R5-0345]OMD40146.1 galactoside O-acetyltransferase [Paenibacillus odorifer]